MASSPRLAPSCHCLHIVVVDVTPSARVAWDRCSRGSDLGPIAIPTAVRCVFRPRFPFRPAPQASFCASRAGEPSAFETRAPPVRAGFPPPEKAPTQEMACMIFCPVFPAPSELSQVSPGRTRGTVSSRGVHLPIPQRLHTLFSRRSSVSKRGVSRKPARSFQICLDLRLELATGPIRGSIAPTLLSCCHHPHREETR